MARTDNYARELWLLVMIVTWRHSPQPFVTSSGNPAEVAAAKRLVAAGLLQQEGTSGRAYRETQAGTELVAKMRGTLAELLVANETIQAAFKGQSRV
jgi:hypothetical protein